MIPSQRQSGPPGLAALAAAAAVVCLALACAESGPGPRQESAKPAARAADTAQVPARFRAAAEYSEERGGRALVIVEGGLVVGVGQNGHRLDAPHRLSRGTESFWGVLAAAAESDGLLALDEPVSATIPDFADDPLKRGVRVRQLLTFTSGLEAGTFPLQREPTRDRYARALSLEMVAAPGERFQYGPSHLYVFAELLRRRLGDGRDPVDYLRERLLEPIGVEIADWDRDAAGNPDPVVGASLRARDWAEFGVLVRDRGRWRGRPIVPADALARVFEGSERQPHYGLGFWLNGPAADSAVDRRDAPVFYPGGLADLVVSAGAESQRLYVIPSAGLVVVRFGEKDPEWRDPEFLARLIGAGAGS